MIGAIYQWGRFSAADTHQTALALTAYSIGLAGYAASRRLRACRTRRCTTRRDWRNEGNYPFNGEDDGAQ